MSKGRRKAYVPKSFESIEGAPGSRVFASIYIPMMQSKAWANLKNGARVLYLYMKAQYRGQKNLADHPEIDFEFSQGLAKNVYHLYTNMEQFRKDRDSLIENGFIEVVENGRFTRTRNIYRFSDKWQDIT